MTLLRLAIALLTLTPAIALAAPPPPPPPIAAIRQPVDGYDLTIPWFLWNRWIERRKGAVADALLAAPEAIAGETPWGGPILQFRKSGDYGHFLTGEIRVYCRPDADHGIHRATCHYRLRRAYVEPDAAGYQPNAVSRWTQESFDPVALVRRFRELGLTPDTDWWKVDDSKLFADMSSPDAVLAENATVIRLDSRDCPALGSAIEALDGKTARWRMDMLAVGRDGELTPPAPHGVMVEYSLTISAPGEAGRVTIKGSGDELERLFAPVLDAADACEKAAAH